MKDKWGNTSQVDDIREHPIHRCAVPLPQGERQRGGGFAAKKEANPASLRSAAPSKGRGLRVYTLLPMEGGAPKGRRLDGESGMKKSRGDRLKSTIYESTLSTADAVPLPQWGKQDERSEGRSVQLRRLRQYPNTAQQLLSWYCPKRGKEGFARRFAWPLISPKSL